MSGLGSFGGRDPKMTLVEKCESKGVTHRVILYNLFVTRPITTYLYVIPNNALT